MSLSAWMTPGINRSNVVVPSAGEHICRQFVRDPIYQLFGSNSPNPIGPRFPEGALITGDTAPSSLSGVLNDSEAKWAERRIQEVALSVPDGHELLFRQLARNEPRNADGARKWSSNSSTFTLRIEDFAEAANFVPSLAESGSTRYRGSTSSVSLSLFPVVYPQNKGG